MALGMSREEYWNGDIFAPFDYVEADREKQRRENQQAWLQGMYIYEAVSVALQRAFSENRLDLPEYSAEPYPLVDDNKEERETQEAEQYMNAFLAWGRRLNGEE